MRRFTAACLAILPLWGCGPSALGETVLPMADDPATVERLKAQTEYIMSLSEQQVRELAPVESGGIAYVRCPACDYGTRNGNFAWEPERPNRLVCEDCGERFPDHPDYPDDEWVEVDAPEGVHRFYYHEDEQGHRHYLRSRAHYFTREWLKERARDLGELYHATGEDAYARRAAIILHRFAELYPGYVYLSDLPFEEVEFQPYTSNRIPGQPAFRTTRWSWWAYYDISYALLFAYEATRDWEGWADLPGDDPLGRVEQDLLRAMVEFTLGFEDPLTNMSPFLWRRAIEAGRVLQEPAWVHEALGRFERMMEEKFLYDGHWFETSPSYHVMAVRGVRRLIEVLEGYSDPPGYAHPDTGRRLEDVDLRREVPQYALAEALTDRLRLPDGRLIPLNDTWAVHDRLNRQDPPPDATAPRLMPGLGLAVLGAGEGEGEQQVYAHLNYSSGRHHKHRDGLAMLLFAHGRELYREIGYTHTRYRRAWASTTMAHNTVVVDGREGELDPNHTGNRLIAFAATDGLALASASSNAYDEVAEHYRRTLVLVGDEAEEAYLLDIFDVHGGAQHDYLLHGSADEDSTLEVMDVSLRPYEGSLMPSGAAFEEPEGEHDHAGPEAAYGFIRDLRRAEALDSVSLAFRIDDAPDAGVRSHLVGGAPMDIYTGQAPSIRRAEERNHLADRYKAPAFIARRTSEAEGDLRTRFVAVHEPFVDGRSTVEHVSVDEAEGGVLVRVDRGTHGRDYLLLADEASVSFQTPDGPLHLAGGYGFASVDDAGLVRRLDMVGGTKLKLGDLELTGQGRWEGTIQAHGRGASERGRGWFELAGQLDIQAHGALIISFPDRSERVFNVEAIEHTPDGHTRLHTREDPAFEVADSRIRLRSFPQREIEGRTIRYRMNDVASRIFE